MNQESSAVSFFLLTTVVVTALIIICGFFFFSWWRKNQLPSLCPYTKTPLRRATDLSFDSRERTARFLKAFNQFDNPPINFWYASFCRDTGRVFQNCMSWTGAIRVDWTFLQNRCPGNYASWGSLAEDQKRDIAEAHGSLEGFQTELSSSQISPRSIEAIYINTKPGPLYVDLYTKVLIGWQEVPGTDLEVLIVQKPIK